MEASETLKNAWAAVEAADLPEKLHQLAFREAVRLLAPDQAVAVTTTAAPQRGGVPVGGNRTPGHKGPSIDTAVGVSEDEIYGQVTAHTGVDRARLEQLVHLDGDILKVSIPGLRLGANNAERARAVAQILTIVRGFGLGESDPRSTLSGPSAIDCGCTTRTTFPAT